MAAGRRKTTIDILCMAANFMNWKHFLLLFSPCVFCLLTMQYHVCRVFAYMSPTKYKRTSHHHHVSNFAFITSTNVMYMIIWTSHKNHHHIICSECIQAKSASSSSKKGLLDLTALPLTSFLLFFISERSYILLLGRCTFYYFVEVVVTQ